MSIKLVLPCALLLLSAGAVAAPAPSSWVHYDAAGKLAYRTLATGERIMDFSFAGYGGGGVAIPEVPAVATVSPVGGDDSAAIQAAIGSVSRRDPVDGFRGAVQLAAGEFHCGSTLTIATSGVVLRGSGSGPGGTVIHLTGRPHLGIAVRGAVSVDPIGEPVAITDAYVPSGAMAFDVADAAGFRAGDTVLIRHPVTAPWVRFMGMSGMVRDGRKETWVRGEITTERRIAAVEGRRVTLDLPLTDSLDARWLGPTGATVVKAERTGGIAQVGVERLSLVAPSQHVAITESHYSGVLLRGVTDGWVRDVAIADTVGSVSVGTGSRRVTVEGVRIRHRVVDTVGAAKPADFNAGGTQVLFDRCAVEGGGLFYFVTDAEDTGPNVLLHCAFTGGGWIQPHQRWATGLLVDNCHVPGGGIDFMNRGEMGSGHGWTIGWAVAWNCEAESYIIQQPPGAANWAIGCQGRRQPSAMPVYDSQPKGPTLPEGIFESPGAPVTPASLYLAQLRERLGPQAPSNIGY